MKTFNQFFINESMDFWSDSVIDGIFKSVINKLQELLRETPIHVQFQDHPWQPLEIIGRPNRHTHKIYSINGRFSIDFEFIGPKFMTVRLCSILLSNYIINNKLRDTVHIQLKFPPLFPNKAFQNTEANEKDEKRAFQIVSEFLQSNGFEEQLDKEGYVSLYVLTDPKKYLTQSDEMDIDASSGWF